MRIRALALVLAILAAPPAALAQERSSAESLGLGLAAFGASILWGTGKVIYAGAGLLTGGLAWCLTGGDKETALDIIQPAVRGDYLIFPEHITGERTPHFVGRRDPRPSAML
jgi:hypothetical protein